MTAHVDIAVVGSGAAGIAAAVTAARAGHTTLLLDQRPAAGGTGGFSGLTTLCGLYDDEGRFLNDGFAREFAEALCGNNVIGERDRPGRTSRRPADWFPAYPIAKNNDAARTQNVSGETPKTASGTHALPGTSRPLQMGRVWVLPYRPARFREIADRLLTSTPSLQTLWNTPLANVVVESDRIVSLNGFNVGAVIDCSGSAVVARAIGIDCLATDNTTQAPAIVFPLQNVTHDLSTPAAVAQVLLPLVRAGIPPLSFQPNLEPNTITVKFSGRADQVRELIEFLQTHVSGFETCVTPLTEFPLARREGRMIVGHYLLTGADVLAGRKFSDAVARCAWPIEQWGTDGVPRFRYLQQGTHYEIPARSLRAASIQNLFMAGKTISADVDAMASARVMGCCLATGAAAGDLAVAHLESTLAK